MITAELTIDRQHGPIISDVYGTIEAAIEDLTEAMK